MKRLIIIYTLIMITMNTYAQIDNDTLTQSDLSKTIAFYLQDGVEILDFGGPLEVFVYAGYEVFTVSKTKDPIKSQGVLKVIPDYSIEDAPQADIIAFFGGNARNAYEDKNVISWIKKQEDIQYHFSVCTGAFMLAEAGILDNKTATTFHDALADLEDNYPQIDVRKDVRFVDNGKVVTTAGISAGIDGALHLVAKLQGLNAAKRVAYYMEYDNWTPGDGLLLTDENPYHNTLSPEQIQEYTGTYEFKNGDSIRVVYDETAVAFFARTNETNLPIYHEDEDVFSDVRGEPIYFRRDSKGVIIGYSLSQNGEVFKRLSN